MGLVAPHIARSIVGLDYRRVIPYSGVLGAIMVVVADVAARIVLRPQEIPVGVMMALVGALEGATLMSTTKHSAKPSWITVGQGRWPFSLKVDRRGPSAALAILAVTFAVLVLSISYGAYDISISEVVQTLIHTLPDDHPDSRSFNLVVFTFRLPRILTAFLVGMAPATSGAILQGITRNPLAEPGILGVNAGTGLVAVSIIVWFKDVSTSLLPFFEFGDHLHAGVRRYP